MTVNRQWKRKGPCQRGRPSSEHGAAATREGVPRVAEFWETEKGTEGTEEFPDRTGGGARGQDPLPPDSFPKGRTGR